MLLLSRKDIESVFTMKETVEAVKDAFTMFSQNKIEVPLRTAIKSQCGGTFLTMPSYAPELECECVKCINHFPMNIGKNIPTLPTQVLLADANTGMFVAMLDGLCVTQLRTGASSGAAFDVLAKKECYKGAMIGTGGQAAAQLEAMLVARQLEEVWIYDMDLNRCRTFVEAMSQKLASYNVKLVPAASSDEAVKDADLLITVTPSLKPVFDGKMAKPGATVSCVGSFAPNMQEMSPEVLSRAAKIYFDSKEAVLSEAGDILIPLKDGIITESDFTGDLGDVILGNVTGRENDEEIIVYKTVGIGAQDLVTSKRIYDKAIINNIGTVWE